MKNHHLVLFTALFAIISVKALSQTTDTGKITFGVWQNSGGIVDQFTYPHLKGRIFNYKWKDLETSPGVWNWTGFDEYIKDRVSDSLPVILMIFTKNNAPDWLYNNGVPKVIEKDSKGVQIAYCPYFSDPTYKMYFKRMITTVRQHIEQLPSATRNWIAGIQGCFGEEGDYIGYRGTVDKKYDLTPQQFSDLFKEFSAYYYNEYKNTNPKIYLLSNPSNNGDEQTFWILQNCPNGWMKYTHLGKVYQINNELDKAAWLLDVLNKKQSGEFIRSRSELSNDNLAQGWWKTNTPRNFFALMCYMTYWGMDWSNQLPSTIENSLYIDALSFFNKYSGQKDTLYSKNAMCAFRDGLDAADATRFPASTYGEVLITNRLRFKNIANKYAAYGAKLDDVDAAMGGEGDNLDAKGINDVGWRIFPGNYERYLHQIDANGTSTGYWNVSAPSDPNSIYGRFARAISNSAGKDALYFNIDNTFLNNAPVNGKFPISIDITYLDKGTGGFALYYDSKTNTDQLSIQVTCANTGKWKKASVIIDDAYMANRGLRQSDFYIKSTTAENVFFSVVELSKPLEKTTGGVFSATSPLPFDTICYTTTTGPHSFIINASFLNGSKVSIGPVAGFRFSETSTGTYKDSVLVTDYGSSFHKTVYVMFMPPSGGSFNKIPVTGGGAARLDIPVNAVALNSSPALSAIVTGISCNNAKNGAIDLVLTGGTAPFSYQWSSSAKPFKYTTQDVSDLTPANYSVVVTSKAACTISATFSVTEPKVLDAVAVQDSAISCRGGSTTITVSATGGTQPYNGTGNFRVSQGHYVYTIKDKNGCQTNASITLQNGTGVAPDKPASISGDDADAKGLCGSGTFAYQAANVAGATSYAWSLPANSSVSSLQSNGKIVNLKVNTNFNNGYLGVSAVNSCGASNVYSKYITEIPKEPASISGPGIISKLQLGIIYKVQPSIAGVKYRWTVPSGVTILSGQNTDKITVNWGTSSGRIQVQAQNDCATSSAASMSVGFGSFLAAAKTADENLIVSNQKITTQLVPNPATNFAMLNVGFNANYTMQICDIAGKVLLQKNNCSGSQRIELSSYTNGIYLVNIIGADGNKQTLKLLKQ